MALPRIHKNTRLPLPLKILLISGVTLAGLFVALYGVLLIAARATDADFSARLCGTMTERNLFFTDWFFTTEEIRNASRYVPPAKTGKAVPCAQPTAAPKAAVEARGNVTVYRTADWECTVYEVASSSLSFGKSGGGSAENRICIGLTEYPGAVFTDGCLSYTAEGGNEKIAFLGCLPDGTLSVGAMTVTEAVNAGFVFGVSVGRILVLDGAPCTDLRGGYAPRAAVGQRADGSVFLAVGDSLHAFYPCGITYDTLAWLLYENGAVRGAALPCAGEALCGNTAAASFGGKAGWELRAELTVPATD